MPIYKRTDGSLVIASSPPSGGTLVTVNTGDGLSVNAPLLRTLDSSSPGNFHPAMYYSGGSENSGLVYNSATIFCYKRSADPVTDTPGTCTYDFTTGVLSGISNGWTTTVPTTIQDLWICKAVLNTLKYVDTISSWVGPYQSYPALATELGLVKAQISSVSATVSDEITRVVTDTQQVAQRIQSLESNYSATNATTQATIANVQTTLTTADSALASSITSLTTVVNAKNQTFRQGTTPTAITTGDIWIDTANNNLLKVWNGSAWVTSQDNNKTTTFYQSTAPTATATGDLWLDTANGNLLKRWSGSAWVAVDDTRTATNAANITAETTARTNADISLATKIDLLQATYGDVAAKVEDTTKVVADITSSLAGKTTSLETTLNGYTAKITQTMQSIDGMKANYGVAINNNGSISGFALTSDLTVNGRTPTSAFVVAADKFAVVDPSVNYTLGNTPNAADCPFMISGGITYIKEANILTLTVGKVTTGTLPSSTVITIGTATDGVTIDGGAKTIKVTDTSATRVTVGSLGTTYGISGLDSSNKEVFRLDDSGLYATLTAKSMYAHGLASTFTTLASGTVIFSGEPTTTFTATSCTISGTSLTIGGTVTGTVAFGQIVYFIDSAGYPCCKRITAGSGTSWTVTDVRGITLSPFRTGNITNGFVHSVAHPTYPPQHFRGTIRGTTLTTPVSFTGIYPGQLIMGNGVLDNTFIISGSGTSYQVSKPQTTLQDVELYFPIRGTGTPTGNILLKDFTSDYNPTGDVIGVRAEISVLGICYNVALTNTDVNSKVSSLLAYNNYSGSAWVARAANTIDSDSSDTTNFAVSKITPQYLTTGTPVDIMGRNVLNMLSLGLDGRATTSTTTANTYFTKYSYVAKALTNYIPR